MNPLPNLLIVDDTEINLVFLETILHKVNVNLIRALSGAEALRKIQGVELALAIIDIRMPGMDGYELVQKMNEARPGEKVPVIFLTASQFDDIAIFRGYDSGAVDYLTKPINNNVLLCKIKVFLDLYDQKQMIIRDADLLRKFSAELALANDTLKKSEEKYRSYIDNAPDGVFVSDENGNFIEVNQAASEISGYSRDELLSMSVSDLLPDESVKKSIAYYKNAIQTGTTRADFQFRHKNGTKRWLAVEAVKLTEMRFLGFIKDITRRKEAEEAVFMQKAELEMQNQELSIAIENSELASKKYSELYDFAPSGYFTLSYDKVILDMNHCGAGMLGIGNQRSRLTNTHFDSYVSPNTRPVFNAFIDKIFKSKQVEKCEVVLETEDNHPKFIHIEGGLTGNGLFCLLNVVDITERKLTEDTLMQTSARLALATRAGGVGVWDLDIASNRLIWDDHMFSLYGLDKKDFKQAYNSWLAGVHPDDKERSDRDIQMAIHGEKEFDTEFRVCWPDGSIHNIRAIAEVQHDSSGKVRSLIGTNWDITDQKKLEEKLKSSETNFRAFFETMNDMIIVGNTEGKIIYVNNALRNILGYQDEDLKDMYVLDLNPAELRADAEEIMGEMIAGKRNTCPLPLARKDGTLVPAETHVWFGKWDGKDCIFGLAKDLSAVQEALQKFNRIFNSNPALMAISTIPEGLFTDVNNTFLAKTEYSRQEIIGKTTAELGLFLQPEKQQEAAMELASTGILHNFELQIKTKTGKILDGLFSGEIIESQGKKYFLTVMIDISERKKAEDELRRSESNLAEAQRIAHLGSWEWKMATNTVKWSKEMFRIFDVNPDTFDGNPDSLVRVLHPDDVERFTRNLISNVVSAEASSLEYRAIRVDGSIRYILADGRMSFDKTGQPFRSVGTVQDITDRKRAEEDLYQSKSFLNSVVENIPHMIFIKDAKELRFIRLNKAAENLLGIPIDEMVGKNDYDFFSKELADNYNEKDRKVLGNKNMADIPEEPIQTRYKGTRILHTKKVPILNNQGEPEYLLGISEDITEFKQSELTRKIQEEKYRTILSSSPDGVFLIDLDGIISEVSDIGLGIFGARSREDLVGKSIFHFAPSEARNTVREIIEKTMNEGLAQNIELRIRKLNKSILLSEISSTLIQDMDGKPISFMIIIRDISHRKVMETKQIHADRMANLGEMASGIAHEINQPLNIISMVMDKILFESSKTETIKLEFLKNKSDKIFDNIIRIRNIIDHVRTFSRSHDDYVLTAFDINTSIENATSMILEQFKHMGIKLLLQLDKNIPPLFGNTFKFEQVIVNLLVNAKDAVMEKKSKQEDDFEMSVTISSFQEGQFLVAEIADNGIGIPHDDINNIMLPFYTTKEEGKGTGLGLSICYQIVKEMGGTIEIASDRVHGTKIKLLMDLQNIKKK